MNGQLGNGTTSDRLTPVDVVGLTSDVEKMQSGISHTCAITRIGALKCWGANGGGQLGDGTTTNRSTPVDVLGLDSGVKAVAVSSGHTCAVTSAGGVKCWGANGDGKLGIGSNDPNFNSSVPVDVIGPGSGVTEVVSGYNFTCALRQDVWRFGEPGVVCWGFNQHGFLGDNTRQKQSTPQNVALPGAVRSIAVVGSYSASTGNNLVPCALLYSGVVMCWGGQYGLTPQVAAIDPARFSQGSPIGPDWPYPVCNMNDCNHWLHQCRVTPAGDVQCWGANGSGQLGDGSTTYSQTPVDVIGFGVEGPLLTPTPTHHHAAIK